MQTEAQVVNKIRVGDLLAGLNPRTHFDKNEMTELEDSIRVKGVIQPILVRPTDDGGYAVVAGNRRWAAARTVFGEDYEIPVHVKAMSADEADELALIENVLRSDMSPAEEAQAASKILGRCEGNREEAAKRLGWSRSMLDKRLALMNCSDAVRQALIERKITLSHAELLAAAPKARQELVIVKMLEAPSLVPIAQFKAQLESISKSLSAAIFDKTNCAGCPHDSSAQAAMFTEAIGSGHCTNSACYDKKTMAVLEAKKVELSDEFPKVLIVNPGENFTVIKLVAEGALGVGEEQEKACKGCANFGAVISNVPGKIGNTYLSQCFDSACNMQKVAARITADKEAAKEAAKPTTQTPANSSDKPAKAGEKPAKAAPKTDVTVQTSQRVLDYRVGIWRTALKRELFADPEMNLVMLIAVMMTLGGSNVSSTKMAAAFEKMTGKRPSHGDVGLAATMVTEVDEKTRQQMLSGIVISIIDGVEKSKLPSMLEFLQADIGKHWKLDAEFLNLLTKSEIEAVAVEIGLKDAFGENFYSMLKGKKDEIIKQLLAVEGFEYAGKVPSSMQFKATTSVAA